MRIGSVFGAFWVAPRLFPESVLDPFGDHFRSETEKGVQEGIQKSMLKKD